MKKVKALFLICLALILTAGITLACIFIAKNQNQKKNITIAFFDTDSSVETAVNKVAEAFAGENELKINIISLNHESPLSSQIKKAKPDVIFAPAGYAQKSALEASESLNKKAKTGIKSQALEGLFSSMRESTITKDGLAVALPLVFDNFEINIEKSAFYMSGMKSIASWDDITEFSKIQQKKPETGLQYPVSLAGAEPVLLLDFFGALGEAFEGIEAYNKAAEILIKASEDAAAGKDFDANKIANDLFVVPDAPLAYPLYYINQYRKNNYLTPAFRQLINSDINAYIQQRLTNVFFTTLSIHRTYDVRAIERYSSIYIPSKNRPEQRHFTATITYAIPSSKKANTQKLMEYLLTAETQGRLSQITGLAPVLANCPTPDQQADDARFWVAATSAPVAGLGHEAYFTPAQQQQLRDVILGLIY